MHQLSIDDYLAAQPQSEYHNTTEESGELLEDYRRRAGFQDTAVLSCFKQSCLLASPSQVHAELIRAGVLHRQTPLTSIRRSITNLTRRGLLVKTDAKVTGIYGRPEYRWRYL